MTEIDWKARAEAAEADLQCALSTMADYKEAAGNYRARIADLEARLATAEKIERNRADAARSIWEAALRKHLAAIADLEARLARVPSREEVARAIHDADWAKYPPSIPFEQIGEYAHSRYSRSADAVLALFAKQETKR